MTIIMRHNLHSGLTIRLLLFLTLITASSCRDFLYVEPTNKIAIAGYSDVRSLMGAHLKDFKAAPGNSFRGASVPFMVATPQLILSYYSGVIDFQSYMETYIGSNNRKHVENSLQWMHPDLPADLWALYYGNIGFYNMILHELDKFPSEDGSENAQVSAEARILRAWSFFQLVKLFVPYASTNLGLPLNTSPETVGSYDSSRPTQAANYDFITNELEGVLTLDGKPDKEYNLFFDPYIVHAILAQVYLYKGGSAAREASDYDRALSHAREALKSGVDYSVFDRHVTHATIGFYPDTGFALYNVVVTGQLTTNYTGIPPYVSIYPSRETIDLYEDNDLRKAVYFDPTNDYAIMKSIPNSDYDLDEISLFSGAELKLIAAEALARLGREDEATKELQEFALSRYKAGTLPPYDAEDSVLAAILEERQREFILEGDILWIDAARTGGTISHYATDKEDGSTYTIAGDDFRYTLPIPKSGELDYNKIPQNPGWGTF